MEWLLPILLLAALLASVGLSIWQTRRYTREINALVLDHNEPGRHLVSGRGKGRLRGGVAVLVVDSRAREIIAARTMVGASVFTRLRPAPELEGPVDGVLGRTDDLQVRRALEDALARLATLPGAGPTLSAPSLSSVPTAASPEVAGQVRSGRIRVRRTATVASRPSLSPAHTGDAPGGPTPRS